MRYHLFQKFFGKMVKIKETPFLSTRGMTLMFGNCRSQSIQIFFSDTNLDSLSEKEEKRERYVLGLVLVNHFFIKLSASRLPGIWQWDLSHCAQK